MTDPTPKSLTIWVLTEGIAGTENQCLAVAEALGGAVTVKRVGLRWPFSWFSPYLSWGEGPRMLTRTSDPIAAPWPDVVVAGGRKAVGIARYIGRASSGKTFTIMMQNPKVALHHFDLVAAPYHDQLTGLNVITTDGAPNRVTTAVLDTARFDWSKSITPLPGPRIAVLIGGKSKTFRLGLPEMDSIIHTLRQIQQIHGAGLMITVSRRTPAEVTTRLKDALSNDRTLIFTGDGPNPYHGFLAHADYIICTGDSVSMLSDAASTGKPVFLFRLPGGSPKFDRVHDHLVARGVIREMTDALQPTLTPWNYAPYNDARLVAERAKNLIERRHS